MLQNDVDIIGTLTMAYESGMNVPKIYFEKEYEEVRDSLRNQEIIHNGPVVILKPQGIEFSYIIFWTGRKFRGGYVSINNNYFGVQRGRFDRNGETLFVSHIPEIKKCYKKILPEEPDWIVFSFILEEKTGKIYFWSKDNKEHYFNPIEKITGVKIHELEEIFINEEKFQKPSGYISSMMIYNKDMFPKYILSSDKEVSISKCWKNIYNQAELIDKNYIFTYGLESYMRKGFALLNTFNKIF